MFGNTNIVITNELLNTLAFFISIIFHMRNLSNLTSAIGEIANDSWSKEQLEQ